MRMALEKPKDLREACVQEALAIIETSGLEQLSLREISRRLGVSHQAPYKHFPSRDHILAEVVRRAFDAFAAYLDEQGHSGDARADMEAMGRAYLGYAVTHPLQYRLMFGTPLPDPQQHPDMMRSAQHAFSLLRDCLRRMSLPTEATDLDALFVWSSLHGLASALQSQTIDTLDLPPDVLDAAAAHTLWRIGVALGVETDAPGPAGEP